MKQNMYYPTHWKYEDKVQQSMRTWSIHQTAHLCAYYDLVEPSAYSFWQPPNIVVMRVKHRDAQLVQSRADHPVLSCSTSDLTCFLKHPRKAHLACPEHRVLEYWIAACCSPSRPVGRNVEDRVQKQLVAIIRKAPHPCHRSATQLVLWHFFRNSRHSGGMVRQSVQVRIGRKTTTR